MKNKQAGCRTLLVSSVTATAGNAERGDCAPPFVSLLIILRILSLLQHVLGILRSVSISANKETLLKMLPAFQVWGLTDWAAATCTLLYKSFSFQGCYSTIKPKLRHWHKHHLCSLSLLLWLSSLWDRKNNFKSIITHHIYSRILQYTEIIENTNYF